MLYTFREKQMAFHFATGKTIRLYHSPSHFSCATVVFLPVYNVKQLLSKEKSATSNAHHLFTFNFFTMSQVITASVAIVKLHHHYYYQTKNTASGNYYYVALSKIQAEAIHRLEAIPITTVKLLRPGLLIGKNGEMLHID